MNILVNEKHQAQCPKCGQWNNLVDYNGLIHKFNCCCNTIVVAIDKENLDNIGDDG